jgi:hypothetical protein
MMHLFLLLVYLGDGDQRRLISNDMYFESVVRCNFFAKEISRRYGNYNHIEYLNPDDKVTAYCIPKYIKKGSVEVY